MYWSRIGFRVVWHIGLMGIAFIPWYLVSGALVCARALRYCEDTGRSSGDGLDGQHRAEPATCATRLAEYLRLRRI